MELAQFKWVVFVTAVYVGLYYSFMIPILLVRIRLAKDAKAKGVRFDRYRSEDRGLLARERTFLNTLEQMPPFLIALWIHACFVEPNSAAIAGAVYVVARALYPFLLGKAMPADVPIRIFFSTFVGYGVIAYLIGATLLHAFL